jgi:hypothetical protein
MPAPFGGGHAFYLEVSALQRANVLSLPTLRSFCDFEFHALAFLKAAESTGLNCREVHKHIFAALPADEAVAFGVVKPLDCSLFRHTLLVFLSIDFTLRESVVLRAGLAEKQESAQQPIQIKRMTSLTEP